MKKSLCYFLNIFIFVALFCCTGCFSVDDELTASDISVETLEARMAKRVDPHKIYRNSKGFEFRQIVKVPQFLDDDIESVVETKMVMPDKFRITTLQDNEPRQIICSNGSRGWIADRSAKTVKVLEGEKLQQLLTFSKLGTPAGEYRKIFVKVEIFRLSNDEGDFYVLDCAGKDGSSFRFYVDSDEFLLRRMKGQMKLDHGTLDYDARIKSYSLFDGVMIPRITETVQNGQKQIIELLKYKLDPPVSESDFQLPVF